jgi:hypothetical protein
MYQILITITRHLKGGFDRTPRCSKQAGVQLFTTEDLRGARPAATRCAVASSVIAHSQPPTGWLSQYVRAGCSSHELIGSSGWTRTSNPPVNRRKTAILPPVAPFCAETPDRELHSINTGPIEDQNDAPVSRPNPRLDVGKGQQKGNVKSG